MYNVRTPGYNYVFDPSTGHHQRWGTSLGDDPQWSPIGPEILDIEVSEVCHGGCKFCYKSNVASGRNMSFDTFKAVIDKMPSLTQIAFGIGDIDANPHLWPMILYARSKGVIPNITINGYRMNDTHYDRLMFSCGAVAVSLYDKEDTYNAVYELTRRGMTQINIHALVARELHSNLYELINDAQTDPRLEKLNAVVLLSLKQRGRGVGYHRLPDLSYEAFVQHAMKHVRVGFDSCSAHRFRAALGEKAADYEEFIEPCESGLFSSYVNVEGKYFPCSFAENGEGIDVANCENFLEDVWYHPNTIAWRRKLIAGCRHCPLYEV
jgi:MoaA/NifB/PqqE/SkfB family radical SAM enzyme